MGKSQRDKEIWKPIKGYEGIYDVSTYGRIRSYPRNNKKKTSILKTYIHKNNGYVYVSLCKDNVKTSHRVHKLVAEAFIPKTSKQINHIDGDKTNNRVDNLEWCTQSENMIHAYKFGLEKPVSKKVICLDNGMIFESTTEAAKWCGGKQSNQVGRVCRGERKKFHGYHFRFLEE